MLKRLLNFCQSQSAATRLLYIDIIHRLYLLLYISLYDTILYTMHCDIMKYCTLCYIVIDTTLWDIMDYILFMRLYDMQNYYIYYSILCDMVLNTTSYNHLTV